MYTTKVFGSGKLTHRENEKVMMSASVSRTIYLRLSINGQVAA